MPFDAFTVQLLVFFGLITTSRSLPAEPHFHPWHEGSPYGSSHGSRERGTSEGGDARKEVQMLPAFGRRNASQSRREPGTTWRSPYELAPQEMWFQQEQRGRTPQEFPDQIFYRRSSASPFFVSGGGSYEAQTFGNGYSSHVNREVPERGDAGPKRATEDGERVVGAESRAGVDGRINFEDAARNARPGVSREEEGPHPRIITPKGGTRRPVHGSPGKNQSKPANPGATNTIPTTEKTFRNLTQNGSKGPRPGSSKPLGGDIVFPDGYRRQKFTPRISKCGKRTTFCEVLGEEYPSDHISQVLKKEGAMFREFFGMDVISDPNITERINPPEENSLCPYRQEVVFPRAAQNKEDKWLFIVNQDQYVQGVTVEVCLNPESRCILTEGFPLGYTPYCKQKYIERRLVAIGEDGKPHSDSFRLPSCCSCVVRHESSARTASARSARTAPVPAVAPESSFSRI